MSNDIAVREETGLTTNMVAPGEIMRVINHVHEVIKDAMKEGIDNDYGIIPGTAKKTLLKPGAEKLLMAFGLTAIPRQPQIIDLANSHREVTIETEIIHANSRTVLTVGLGSCSTMEGKYRYRKADLACTECGAAAIIKGKAEFGGGWICYGKKGGCGKKWTDAESPFEGVTVERVEHDNPADYYNTVLKMASKRSMVDGAIRATASSAMFTQDMDEVTEETTKRKTVQAEKKNIAAPAEKKPVPKPILLTYEELMNQMSTSANLLELDARAKKYRPDFDALPKPEQDLIRQEKVLMVEKFKSEAPSA